MARLYSINEDYFDEIDTPTKAYLLGFLFADGSVRPSERGRQMRVQVGIQEGDREFCELLVREISPDMPVRRVHTNSMINHGDNPQVRMAFTSNKLGQALEKHGCVVNKTVVGLSYPKLNKALDSHFIRGFFDGDGGITVNIRNYKYVRKTTHTLSNAHKPYLRKRCYFTGTSKEFLETVLQKIGVSKVYWTSKTKRLTCWVAHIERHEDIAWLQKYMYKDSEGIRLTRKYDKFNMSISSQATDTSVEGSETT